MGELKYKQDAVTAVVQSAVEAKVRAVTPNEDLVAAQKLYADTSVAFMDKRAALRADFLGRPASKSSGPDATVPDATKGIEVPDPVVQAVDFATDYHDPKTGFIEPAPGSNLAALNKGVAQEGRRRELVALKERIAGAKNLDALYLALSNKKFVKLVFGEKNLSGKELVYVLKNYEQNFVSQGSIDFEEVAMNVPDKCGIRDKFVDLVSAKIPVGPLNIKAVNSLDVKDPDQALSSAPPAMPNALATPDINVGEPTPEEVFQNSVAGSNDFAELYANIEFCELAESGGVYFSGTFMVDGKPANGVELAHVLEDLSERVLSGDIDLKDAAAKAPVKYGIRDKFIQLITIEIANRQAKKSHLDDILSQEEVDLLLRGMEGDEAAPPVAIPSLSDDDIDPLVAKAGSDPDNATAALQLPVNEPLEPIVSNQGVGTHEKLGEFGPDLEDISSIRNRIEVLKGRISEVSKMWAENLGFVHGYEEQIAALDARAASAQGLFKKIFSRGEKDLHAITVDRGKFMMYAEDHRKFASENEKTIERLKQELEAENARFERLTFEKNVPGEDDLARAAVEQAFGQAPGSTTPVSHMADPGLKTDVDPLLPSVGGKTPVPGTVAAGTEEMNDDIMEDGIERSVIAKYSRECGLQREDLAGIEGFVDLSKGQKLLVLENLKQLALGRIGEEAEKDVAKDTKESGWIGRILMSVSKKYQIAKSEKRIAGDIMGGGAAVHGEVLRRLVAGMRESGPAAEVGLDGKSIDIRFAEVPDGASEADRIVVDSFNAASAAFARIPYEWSLETATKEQRAQFEAASDRYIESRGPLLDVEKRLGNFPDSGMLAMNEIDGKVNMMRFLQNNPDLEKQLDNLRDQGAWRVMLGSVVTERGLYMGLGYAGRTLLAGALGWMAAPAVAMASGGFISWKRAKETLRDREVGGRRGKKNDDSKLASLRDELALIRKHRAAHPEYKEAKIEEQKIQEKIAAFGEKNFVSMEDLSTKMETILTKMESISDPDDGVKTVLSLNARLRYTKRKLEEGLIDFGETAEERVHGQYRLIQLLSRAESVSHVFSAIAEGAGEKSKKDGKKTLNERLESFLNVRSEKITEAERRYVRNQVLKGVAISGTCAIAGAAIRHFMTEGFPFQEHTDAAKAPETLAPAAKAPGVVTEAGQQAAAPAPAAPAEAPSGSAAPAEAAPNSGGAPTDAPAAAPGSPEAAAPAPEAEAPAAPAQEAAPSGNAPAPADAAPAAAEPAQAEEGMKHIIEAKVDKGSSIEKEIIAKLKANDDTMTTKEAGTIAHKMVLDKVDAMQKAGIDIDAERFDRVLPEMKFSIVAEDGPDGGYSIGDIDDKDLGTWGHPGSVAEARAGHDLHAGGVHDQVHAASSAKPFVAEDNALYNGKNFNYKGGMPQPLVGEGQHSAAELIARRVENFTDTYYSTLTPVQQGYSARTVNYFMDLISETSDPGTGFDVMNPSTFTAPAMKELLPLDVARMLGSSTNAAPEQVLHLKEFIASAKIAFPAGGPFNRPLGDVYPGETVGNYVKRITVLMLKSPTEIKLRGFGVIQKGVLNGVL